MTDPFRNLRLYWHRLRRTRVHVLDGVRIATDDSVPKFIRSVIYKGSYEGAERALLKRVVRSGDTVLEIGAGIGFVGLLSARLAAPGRVVSYEANPGLEPVIRGNYALNPAAPELHMRAITTDGAPVTFHTSDNVVSSSLYARQETQGRVTVESTAFADALRDVAPDILVMDVEGAEVDLLAEVDLAPVRAAVIELHPHIVGSERIDALLASLDARGFKVTARAEKNVVLTRRSVAP